MIDFKIKGTKLPVIPKGIEYSLPHWTDGVTDITSSTKENLVSFGTKQCAGEEWILAEKSNFQLQSYYMFKLSDIERLTNQKTENMVTIKREQLKSIHDIACTTWQKKIKNIAKEQPFGEIELSQSQIDEMFKAAQSQQLPTLEEIFGKQIKDLDFRSGTINFKVDDTDVFGSSDMSVHDSFIGLPVCEEDKNKFFLNPNYNWELRGCELIVTRKK